MFKRIFLLSLLLTGMSAFGLRPVDEQIIPSLEMLRNPGFESGKTGWASSGGTFAIVTSGSNLLAGNASATFDASATSQYVQSNLLAVPNGLKSSNCLGSIWYLGGDSNLTFQATDGTNVLNSVALAAATIPTKLSLNFVCPASGSVNLKVLSSADAAIVALDRAHLGSADNLSEFAQAEMYGSATWPIASSCVWSHTTSGAPIAFPADSDCTFPAGSNLSGRASAPATKIPAVTFASLPAGEYLVQVSGEFRCAANQRCDIELFDGTSSYSKQSYGGQAASVPVGVNAMTFRVRYTAPQSSITFQIYGGSNSTSGNFIDATNSPLIFTAYRFPLAAERAVKIEQSGWFIDANISGANPDLGTSAQTAYVGIENGSLSLTQNSGSATAWIPCSSTNDSSGATCSAGNESLGVSFTVPYAGDYQVCSSFTHGLNLGASGYVRAAFQLVETPNAAQTISQEGRGRIQSGSETTGLYAFPHRLCGTFNFSSAGRKTVRLFYEQAVQATITGNAISADASSTIGQRDVRFEVYPLTRQVGMPILVNGVTTSNASPMRVETANINCDSGSAILAQNGSWVSTVGNVSSGACAITFVAGTFSAAPVCFASQLDAADPNAVLSMKTSTSSSISVDCDAPSTGTDCTNYDVSVLCIGPR